MNPKLCSKVSLILNCSCIGISLRLPSNPNDNVFVVYVVCFIVENLNSHIIIIVIFIQGNLVNTTSIVINKDPV